MYFSIIRTATQRMAAPEILAVTNVATDASGISPTSISSPRRAAMLAIILISIVFNVSLIYVFHYKLVTFLFLCDFVLIESLS